MKLPIGMLVYWAHRFDETRAILSGMWYYKEMYVPSTREEKRQSINDLKSKLCTVINIQGTFSQISDLLMQADKFHFPDPSSCPRFNALIEQLKAAPEDKPFVFDDIYHLKGTALTINTTVDVDESMEEIMSILNEGKPVSVTISADWSFQNDFIMALNQF